jgi:hypothetical protein
MKARTVFLGVGTVAAALGWLIGLGSLAGAEARADRAMPPANRGIRVGVFDSRAVAYAEFCSEAHLRELKQRVAEAKAAKAAGDEARWNQLSRELKERQLTAHLQVFSTAPVDEILAEIADRVSAVKRELGLSSLVSKWDAEGLARVADAEQVDVTMKLVAAFPLSEKQSRTLAELLKHEPLPLPLARLLAEHDLM